MMSGYRNMMMSTYHARRHRRQATMRVRERELAEIIMASDRANRLRSKGKFAVNHKRKGGRTGSSRKK